MYLGMKIDIEGSRKIIEREKVQKNSSPRFGEGNLTTPLRPDAIGMDGSVWHRSDAALRLAKKKKQPIMFSFPSPVLPVINALAKMLLLMRTSWTHEQKEAVTLKPQFATQQELASYLGISPAAVNQRLHGANYDLYQEGKEAFALFLERELNAFEMSLEANFPLEYCFLQLKL